MKRKTKVKPIPIGTLVQLKSGIRLFVAEHWQSKTGEVMYLLNLKPRSDRESIGLFSAQELQIVDLPSGEVPPSGTAEVEQLRLELIQSSINFMRTISTTSLPAFMAIERKKIINLCRAGEQELRDLDKMLK